MKEWNVVVTTHDEGFERTCRTLEQIAPIHATRYMNVLVMKIDDFEDFAAKVAKEIEKDPGILKYDIARIAPLEHTFEFHSPQEFESEAQRIIMEQLDKLEGRSFYVRIHRRGLKGSLDSRKEESFIGSAIIEALAKKGKKCTVNFEDPDYIIDIETIDHQGGVSLWEKEKRQKYLFLHL